MIFGLTWLVKCGAIILNHTMIITCKKLYVIIVIYLSFVKIELFFVLWLFRFVELLGGNVF